MANESIPSAGTPPAVPPAQGGQTPTPAEPGKIILSQEQFDQRWADKCNALEKDLGIPLKDAKAIIAAKKKADEDNKTELEKLTGERDTFKTERDSLNLRLAKMEALLGAGVPSEKVPKLLKRVSGSTAEEIAADIAEMKADGLIPAAQPPNAAQGAGNPGVPNNSPDSSKKIWKESEIKELRLSGKLTDALMQDIRQATLEGRVQ
jgi:hypothetical protein